MSHNPIRPWRNIERRKSRQIRVGNVLIGGDAPIAVQTMTNTPTEDAAATIDQIIRCADAGADIVRVSCPTEDATRAMREIVKASPVPLVADIHFHYKRGVEAADAGAACLRINPGNIGSQARVKEVVAAARANGCSIRIGVNGGSLEKHLLDKYGEPCPDAMVESALDHARILDELGFVPFDRTGGELLFNVLAERYERRSVLITTNLAFAEWPRVFGGDEKLAAAALDRLAHHSTVLTTSGPSYRSRVRAKANAERKSGDNAPDRG